MDGELLMDGDGLIDGEVLGDFDDDGLTLGD